MAIAEGKLFKPLAFTKTFALTASFVLGFVVLPTLTYYMFSMKAGSAKAKKVWNIGLIVLGLFLAIYYSFWLPLTLVVIGALKLLQSRDPLFMGRYSSKIILFIILAVSIFFLTEEWVPLGYKNSLFANYLFVLVLLGMTLLMLMSVVRFYEPILKWCLENKGKFLLIPLFTLLLGIMIWL